MEKMNEIKGTTGSTLEKRMIVLVGLPGSGKSTFSKRLCEVVPTYKRINQDELGSRKKCESLVISFVKKGYSVVIDRCNFDVQQRAVWIELGHRLNLAVDCILMDVAFQECAQRIKLRRDHPTGVDGMNGVNILLGFDRLFMLPQMSEGFERFYSIKPQPEPIYNDTSIWNIIFALETMGMTPPEPVSSSVTIQLENPKSLEESKLPPE